MSQKYPPAVIIGLNDASLSIVRSLGRKGIYIIGLYDKISEHCYTQSKYCSQTFNIELHDAPLINFLLKDVAASLEEPAVLFCATDRSVLTVSKYEEQLKPYFKFVLPSYEVTSTQISKRQFHNFAVSNSFLIPKTFFTHGPKEIEKVAENISFPCVIKPEFRDKNWYGIVPFKVLYVESKNALIDSVKKYGIEGTSLVLQEWIDGGDSEVYFCLTYISQNSKILALCVGRKLCQHPHLTGSTSIAETVWLPEIVDESIRLLTTAGCVGFCSVEFKQSIKNKRYYVTEPTVGRPDTQEGIFLSSGIDAPYIAYLDALGHDLKPFGNAKRGIKWINEPIKWINEPLAFYTLQKYLWSGFDIKGFLSVCKGKRSYALWSIDDPMPAVNFYKEKMIKGAKRLVSSIFG